MKIEKIVWADVRLDSRWHKMADLDLYATMIATTGYVVKETSEILCVASTINVYNNMFSNIIYIPQCCVTARTILGDSIHSHDTS